MTIPRTSFSGLKLYSPPRAFLEILSLRFFSFTSCEVAGDEVGVDAEESVVSVESHESAREDWSRFLGKNLESPPTDFEEGVGVLALPPKSATEAVGVMPSTGARRSSSSSSSSSSEERPSSWKSATPATERTVPIPSVYM